MLRTATTVLAGVAAAGLLFASSPALACDGDGVHREYANGSNVLAPVDELLSSACARGGQGDCSGQKVDPEGAVKKTQLLRPLNGAPAVPAIPVNARLDASAGVFI